MLQPFVLSLNQLQDFYDSSGEERQLLIKLKTIYQDRILKSPLV